MKNAIILLITYVFLICITFVAIAYAAIQNSLNVDVLCLVVVLINTMIFRRLVRSC